MSEFVATLTALRAAAEATRLRALVLLAEGELTVSELTQILGQSQPRVSRHLKVLAEAGLVERHQEGAWTFYRLSDHPLLIALGIGGGRSGRAPAMPSADALALERLQAERSAAAEAYFAEQAPQWEQLRSLHTDDATIEATMRDMAGSDIDIFLDLGTGTGRMLIIFQDLYRRGIGLDISPEMLALARNHISQHNLSHAQVRRMDFLSDSLPQDVDVACFHHVLHFLPAPEAALAATARTLSPKGRILIADFAPHDHEELREAYAHRRLGFSDAKMADWAAQHDLVISQAAYFDPPIEGGLTSCIWRLDRAPSSSLQKPENGHVFA